MDECFGGTPDGPWRIADFCHVLIMAGAFRQALWPEVRALAARLERSTLPVSRIVVVGSSPQPSATDSGGRSGLRVPIEAATELVAALRSALEAEVDCLIVEEALKLDTEMFEEIRQLAASDPMIAGVSPRFGDDAANQPSSAGITASVLPRATYLPLPDRRCLYLKASVLAQFRPELASADLDWDDYALQINRYGFRMARANHAAAAPASGEKFAAPIPLAERAARLEGAYPGTRAAVSAFLTGAPRVAERLLTGLAPNSRGRREIGFDLTHVGAHHSGTAELARALIQCAASSWSDSWEVFVLATPASFEFHFSSAPVLPQRLDPEDPKIFAAFVRIGQPFSWKELDRAVRRAPALVFFMLDTIGLDCIRMAPDELDALWRFTLGEADGLLFNSAFTARQFERRFSLRPGIPKLPSLHSLRVEDYGRTPSPDTEGEGMLIVGNDFAHKYVAEAARLLLAAYPDQPIAALGPKPGAVAGVTSYQSGRVDPEAMAGLYRRARLVIYPSVYEGFGFPVLEALAHRRPVLARALAPFTDLLAGVPEAANVHLFRTDAELLALVGRDLRWIDRRQDVPVRNWDDSTGDLLQVVEDAVRGVNYDRIVRRVDFMRGRLEWIRRKRFRAGEASGDASGEDVERLAAWAGRMAQDAVLKLARAPGSRGVLGLAKTILSRRAAR